MGHEYDAIPMRLVIDSDAIPFRVQSVVCGRTQPTAALVIVMRIIINRHPTVFFRAEFIILRRIHLDFLRLVD